MSALINTDKEYLEWVKDALINNVSKFLIEMGSGFEGVNILPDDYKHSLPSIEDIEMN